MKQLKFFIVFFILFTNVSTSVVYSKNIQFVNEENININLYEKINPSIVSIEANIPLGQSIGTGFVIDKKGIILTSSHVVENTKFVDVTTCSGQVYQGEVITTTSKDEDLAIIKIQPKEKLEVLQLGDFNNIKVGQKVIAIGNPFGFRGTMTTGIVSRIDYVQNKIQTDAAINPGSSGGPLLNVNGEVIGISQSIYNPDNNQSNIGIGFAIPVNDVKKFILLAKNEKKF